MTKLDRRDALKRMTLLVGGGLSASLAGGILSGVDMAQAAHFAKQVENHALDIDEMAVVADLVDRIIPDTDTPGARAAGVPDYIQLMVSEWYDVAARAQFKAGLADVNKISLHHTGQVFLEAPEAARHTMMGIFDQGAQDKNSSDTFFLELKKLTVVGYFTSQIGAEEELRYEAVPGPYEGCVSVKKIGRAWAT